MDTAVVIPIYNEQNSIKNIIAQAKMHVEKVIVVNDGSSDQTSQVLSQTDAICLTHKVNLGKGAALKTGCDYAVIHGAERIVVLDGDGQHNPDRIPDFLDSLSENDVVFGYRQTPESMPSVLKFGNWFINSSIKYLFNIKVKDSQSGYRAFTSDAYKKIRWSAHDYYMETEMITNAAGFKLKYGEIPIETIYADRYKGTTVLDGVKIVVKLLGGRVFR